MRELVLLIFANRSLDFCNAFWGLGDGVLFTRMRGAMRTTEELRNFWKERASIEEQDEIGELRSSPETLRLETDNLLRALSPAYSYYSRIDEDDERGGISRFRFFVYMSLAAFFFFFLPAIRPVQERVRRVADADA
ncbi:hypothetical protein A0H81_03669 [Grifola frondosa]|uniref:Uncharacterized protein n=1 Tax=Grifola frondosa TaxID=5627 RepID=A0A1C7MN00_GRIFR|nr:hypothetical protein A0H81_03669 [Grifola frondosa]